MILFSRKSKLSFEMKKRDTKHTKKHETYEKKERIFRLFRVFSFVSCLSSCFRFPTMKKTFLCTILFLLSSSLALAQEFEIKKFEINARVIPEEFKVNVQTRLRMVNLSPPDLADKILLAGESKPRLSLFLNLNAKVESMKVNEAAVPVNTSEDQRNKLQRVFTEMTTTIAATREFDLDLAYTINTAERNAALHVSRDEIFLLPASFWVPVVHTPYADHGADTAPMSIKVDAPAGLKIVSSGIRKSENSFEQSMAAQPFFFAGDYEVITRGGDAHPVEVYYPRGTSEMGKQQANRLAVEAERIIAFYARYFGVPSMAPFRLIATQARQLTTATTDSSAQGREVSLSTVGAVTIDDNLFRRDSLDLGTIELLASAAARSWIDGQALLRGRGVGVLRDALPVYLTAQYLGERFSDAHRVEAFDRYRRSYATIARNDAPLLMQSPIDRNYITSVYNKGALVWRLLEKQIGQQIFDKVIRFSLSRTTTDVLSLSAWKSPLCNLSRCVNLRATFYANGADRKLVDEIFNNWIDGLALDSSGYITNVLPDLAVGQPQTTATNVESTVANFGTGDLTVEIVATTDKGEKLKQYVPVKASEYSAAVFPAGTKITTIEVDPDKLYLQSDYSNDIYPRKPSESELFGMANLAYSKNDFATAENKAREALKTNPDSPTLQALLGRALLSQNKREEAANIFGTALKSEPLPIVAYGWAHQGLGEIALQQNRADDAARHFRFAYAADLDAITSINARDGALKAERAANAIKIPEDIRAFFQKFDAAVLQSTAEVVNPFLELGSLRNFAKLLVVRKPSAWVTEPLRAEEWDATRTAVDVNLKIKIEGKDYSGRAVYVISRSGGKLVLSEVPVFDVK
jgi:tetratricopeptide (TPR) repeat protein